jgi:ketosteroid isomerase-like protein
MTSAELARSFYDALEAGDLPGGLALLAPDCAWTEMESFGHAGVYVGADAIRDNVFLRIVKEWEHFRMDVEEVLDAGDKAVGIGTYAGTNKATGKPFSARVVHVFKTADGSIAAFEQFADTLAIAAAKES